MSKASMKNEFSSIYSDERKNVEEKLRQRNHELAIINSIADVVSQSLKMDEILNSALDKTLELLNLDFGGIYLANIEGNKLDLIVHRGVSKEFVSEMKTLCIDKATIEAVTTEGRLKRFVLSVKAVTKNRSELKRIESVMKKEGLSLKSSVPVLLQAKEKILGAMIVGNRAFRKFSKTELQPLTSICHQVAIAIDNARLYEDSQRELVERKKIENAMRKSEESYRELANSITDIFFAMDKELRYTYWNRASEKLTGISAKDAIGKSIFEIFPDNEETKRAVEVYQEVLKTQHPKTFVNEYNLGGKMYFFEINAYPSMNGLSIYVKDITERKKAEEKLRNTLNELEERNKELDEYVYMMSHDLRTPLLNIQGFASLMKRKHSGELNETAKHYIDTVISGAKYLETLLNDILALSRAGLSILKLERIELLETVQLCLKSLHTSIVEKEAEVLVPNELPVVHYDPTGLKEVLINLLSNALIYSKQDDRPKIEINWEDNGNENIIRVKDKGIGIDDKYMDKIFQPFERLSGDENGTGLGLSITKKIIERHGGRIWVESKVGEGSTFYFTIPKVTKEVK